MWLSSAPQSRSRSPASNKRTCDEIAATVLLLLQFCNGFDASDILHSIGDAVAFLDRVEQQPVLQLELLRGRARTRACRSNLGFRDGDCAVGLVHPADGAQAELLGENACRA